MKPIDPDDLTVHPKEGEARGLTHRHEGGRDATIYWPREAQLILEACPDVERAPWSEYVQQAASAPWPDDAETVGQVVWTARSLV